MKSRQRGAIEHPIENNKLGEPLHKNRAAEVRNRITILTVSEFLTGVWIWQSSISYRGDSGAMPLGAWSKQQAAKGKRELLSLLDGVGEKIVFAVAPSGDSDLWKDFGLDQWDVINDPDAWAHIDKSLGYDLPCPPAQFHAMHMWKSLTDDEVAAVNATLGKAVE